MNESAAHAEYQPSRSAISIDQLAQRVYELRSDPARESPLATLHTPTGGPLTVREAPVNGGERGMVTLEGITDPQVQAMTFRSTDIIAGLIACRAQTPLSNNKDYKEFSVAFPDTGQPPRWIRLQMDQVQATALLQRCAANNSLTVDNLHRALMRYSSRLHREGAPDRNAIGSSPLFNALPKPGTPEVAAWERPREDLSASDPNNPYVKLTVQIDFLETENDALQNQIATLQKQLGEAQEAKRVAEIETRRKAGALDISEGNSTELSKRNQQLHADNERLRRQLTDAQEQAGAQKTRAERVEQENETLRQQLAAAEAGAEEEFSLNSVEHVLEVLGYSLQEFEALHPETKRRILIKLNRQNMHHPDMLNQEPKKVKDKHEEEFKKYQSAINQFARERGISLERK